MKRIRILHTADIHLDSSFATLGVNARAGAELRAAQRRVFDSILERARDWPADMVLIAGDLFDAGEPCDTTVAFVIEALEHLAPIPVFIAPGDHDPYSTYSPYAQALWPGNVTIFKSGGWQRWEHPVHPLVMHGIGCDGVNNSGEWFHELHVDTDERVHIALAHGAERAHQPPYDDSFAPFDAADIAQDNLSYVALGHFHDSVDATGDATTVMRYPGTPQGRNFLEQGDRSFLEVVIEHNGVGKPTVQATSISCADTVFERCVCRISADQGAPAILDDLLARMSGDASHRAVQVQATGTTLPPAYELIEALRAEARPHFGHVEIIDALEPMLNPPPLSTQHTCMSKLNTAMAERIADACDKDTAAFEAYARDLVVKACRSLMLPTHDAEEPLS